MKPRIIGFLCEWCAARALENLAFCRPELPVGFQPFRINCTGSLELEVVIKALTEADGVLVAGCPPGECHFREGNLRAGLRLKALKRVLSALGEDLRRLRIIWLSSGEGERLGEEIHKFYRELSLEDRGS